MDNMKDTMNTMTEHAMETWLQGVIESAADAPEGESHEIQAERVTPFEEAGLLTRNRGLLVRLSDGSEFQITIVKSR